MDHKSIISKTYLLNVFILVILSKIYRFNLNILFLFLNIFNTKILNNFLKFEILLFLHI